MAGSRGRAPAILLRHGIRQAGIWIMLAGRDTDDFASMLGWESPAARDAAWNAVRADPAGCETRAGAEQEPETR